MDVIITITCYILPIDCLLIAHDAHMISHNGYGPGTRAQGQKAAVPQLPEPAAFGPWSRVHTHYGWTYVHQGQSIGNQ